jgi:hypothetical protein
LSKLIDDAEQAGKLARALMSDVTLYNGDKLAHAYDPERDLAKELEEARELFQSRVAPKHHFVFEEAVRTWASEMRSRLTGEPVDPIREIKDRRNAQAIETANRSITVMALTLVLLVAIAGAVYAFVSHGHHETPDKHEGHR